MRGPELGAHGYLLKTEDTTRLLEALATVAQGGYCQPRADRQPDREPRDAREGLTERELEIAACVGRGMSSRQIGQHFEIKPTRCASTARPSPASWGWQRGRAGGLGHPAGL